MKKIYFNETGWVCERAPYNIPVANKSYYIEATDEEYTKTLVVTNGAAWKVVNGELVESVYDGVAFKISKTQQEINALKEEIVKTKEDVEQVILFGMERPDFERKKQRSVEIILRLRVLEARLKELSKEGK